jgi:hypothetical protein
MNPKHKAIDIIFGPFFHFLESHHITVWVVGIIFNGLIAYFIFKQRKKGDKIKAKEAIIILALLIGTGYAIFDQFRILKTLFEK